MAKMSGKQLPMNTDRLSKKSVTAKMGLFTPDSPNKTF
jgi:hypothetical protein